MLADVLVVAGAIGLPGFLGWFFFGKRAATEARVAGGVQEATIVVEGGYSPNVIRARKGVPLRIKFDRSAGRVWARDVLVKGLLFGIVSEFTFGVAELVNYAWALFDDRRQALHDKIVSTVVVYAPNGLPESPEGSPTPFP